MASHGSSRSKEQPRALLHVAVVAIALLGYMLLPAVHAVHHLIEDRAAAVSVSGEVVGHGCNHSACRGAHASQTNDTDPSDNPHDPSSCEVCQVLFAARKNVELPQPGLIVVAPMEPFVIVAALPRDCITMDVVIPRSSRGPPHLA